MDLLRDVFEAVVQPVVGVLGIYGAQARQAEATGWAAAWDALRRPSLREKDSPWGIVWVAVRRAVLRERLGDDYLSGRARRRGGSARASRQDLDRADQVERPLSWDLLAAHDWEPVAASPATHADGPILTALGDAFAEAGWPRGLARRLVRQIAATAPHPSQRTDSAHGWRILAVELGIEPWQARRATVVVLGLPGRPGLAERVVRDGAEVLRSEAARRQLAATLASLPAGGERRPDPRADASAGDPLPGPLPDGRLRRLGKASGKTSGKGRRVGLGHGHAAP